MKHETPDKHKCDICKRPAKVSPVAIETKEGRKVIRVCRVCRRELKKWQAKKDREAQQP